MTISGSCIDFCPAMHKFTSCSASWTTQDTRGLIECGVGVGLTSAGDKVVLKMIFSRDLN